jgi:excisionase family DNA binding protein
VSDSIFDKDGRRLKSIASKLAARDGAMTADELATVLNVSRLTILRRAKRGTIPCFHVGACVRFDPANIARWLANMGVRRMSSDRQKP